MLSFSAENSLPLPTDLHTSYMRNDCIEPHVQAIVNFWTNAPLSGNIDWLAEAMLSPAFSQKNFT